MDFRNYEHALVELGPGVTTVLGANGQGKTNLVEAAGYLATLSSHRVPIDAPLIRRGCTQAVVRGDVLHDGRRVRVEVEINAGRANRARINGAPLPRTRDCLGVVRRVLFAPEDLGLVKGDPAGRRLFLDDLLVSLAPRFAGVRADLDRVLRQRNSLLKSAGTFRGGGAGARRAAMATLAVWDEQFAALAAELLVARMSLVDRLAEPVARSYCAVAPGARSEDVSLKYLCSIPGVSELGRTQVSPPDGPPRAPDAPGVADSELSRPVGPNGPGGTGADESESGGSGTAVMVTSLMGSQVTAVPARQAPSENRRQQMSRVSEALLAGLAEVAEDEFARGTTLLGPHRDDLVLGLHGMPLRGFASHGESWSMALALRLASYDIGIAEQLPGGPPILILDDVFAELDVRRRDRLADLVSQAEQVLVTAAVESDVPLRLRGSIIRVAAGHIEPAMVLPESLGSGQSQMPSGVGQESDLAHG